MDLGTIFIFFITFFLKKNSPFKGTSEDGVTVSTFKKKEVN